MARVVAVFDDLLLGSNVLGMLRAAGHEAQLAGPEQAQPAGAQTYGELRPDVLRRWARWDVEFGILKSQPDVAEAFDTTLVGPAPQP